MKGWQIVGIGMIGCMILSVGCTNKKNETIEKDYTVLPEVVLTVEKEPNLSAKHNTDRVNEKKWFNIEEQTLATRVLPPDGYSRIDYEKGSFGAFVRHYPLQSHDAKVMLYDGSEKRNQDAHVAVFDMDLANRDLQQCADSIMRMYAEYFYETEQWDKLVFQFVNGFVCDYTKWREGYRVQINGNKTQWAKTHEYNDSYETFLQYLHMVFAYASTLSLEKESIPTSLETLQIGDIWLKSGSPGHVVMVVDSCENKEGKKAFLLAQGYMPAQSFHVLKNPNSQTDPWYYEDEISYPFKTPEYSFEEGQLKRPTYDE